MKKDKTGIVRILHCTFGMNRGGMESRLMDIYRAIDKEKIEFDFLENTEKECMYDEEILNLGGKIFYSGYSRKNILKSTKFIKNLFKNHPEYDAVHIHESYLPSYNSVVKYYAKRYGNKVILHSRNASGTHPILHNIIKGFHTRNVDFCFACSEKAAKWMYTKKKINKKEYKVINNAIDSKKFIYSEKERDKIRKELKIDNSEIVIGHVGRFFEQKNHIFLINFFKELCLKDSNYRLLLVGDGPLKAEIENIVNKYGISDRVDFLGVRKDMTSIYQAFDIFVLPSLFEGLPGVGVEAQASGLISIFSDKITNEIQIVEDLTKMLPIDQGVDCWVREIQNCKDRMKDRRNTYNEICKKGFDINYVVKDLESFYLEMKNE